MKKLLAAILLLSIPAFGDFKVPATPNPVNDYAHVLTRGGKERIAKAVVLLKQETGAQVGVLIVDSLDGSTIEDASMAVATNWKLGSKDKDDGVLLFLAVKDHKFRIEVGRGLEGIVTDYHSKQITMSMKPYLKSGNFDQAFLVGVTGILDRIKAHSQEITSKSDSTSTSSETDSTPYVVLFFFLTLSGFFAAIIYFKNKKEESRLQAIRISKGNPTYEQSKVAKLMYNDVSKRAVKDPGFPKTEKKSRSSDSDDGFVSGVVVGSLISSNKSSSDDSGWGSGSSDSGGSSFGGSDFGGGGGDFGGGGGSDSY